MAISPFNRSIPRFVSSNIKGKNLTYMHILQNRSRCEGNSSKSFAVRQLSIPRYPAMNEEAKRYYDENGYVFIEKCLAEDRVQAYIERFMSLLSDPSLKPRSMTAMRDVVLAKADSHASNKGNDSTSMQSEKIITKFQDFQDDSELFRYCKEPAILNVVKQLIGDDLYSIHTMFINKPPDLGKGSSRHPPHQDLLYFPFRPANLMCASWTALQQITQANGCLYVLPGSHKYTQGLFSHGYPKDGIVNKAYYGIQDVSPNHKDMINVEMDKGDTIFFHPLLIHGSGPNNSSTYRRAISCHYASSAVEEFDIKGTVQEPIAEEVLSMRKLTCNYIDIWRMKSRHLTGVQGKAFSPVPSALI